MQRDIIVAHLRGEPTARPRAWWDIFTLVEGDAAFTSTARYVWATPWWTWPELKVRFLRPVAAVTHYFDYVLFGERYWLMHLHSVLWYGAACFAITGLALRASRDRLAALLGAAMFAVDDAHATAASWLAGRNALVGLSLLATSFWLYMSECKRVRPGWKLPLSIVCLLLALLAAENVVSGLAFFFAYSILFDERPLRHRMIPPLSVATTTLCWLIAHKALGFGSFGSGAYLDPIADWEAFWRAFPDRIVQLVHFQLGAPWALALSDSWSWLRGVDLVARWVLLPTLLIFVVRNVDRDREIAFWSLCAGLGLVPLAAAWPHDRLLMVVGIAWNMLLAHLIVRSVRGAVSRLNPVAIGQVVLSVFIVLLHLGVAPVSLALSSHPKFPPEIVARSLDSNANWWSKQVVFVNVPTLLAPYGMNWERIKLGLPMAARTAVLGATDQEVEVTRLDASTIELYSPPGFLLESFSSSWRGSRAPFQVGDAIQVLDYTAKIARVTVDGRPLRVRFQFARPLEDQGFFFAYWDGREFAPFRFAPVGQRTIIRAVLDKSPLMPEERVR